MGVPVWSGSGEISFWLADGPPLILSSNGRERVISSSSIYKNTNPTMRASPPRPHLTNDLPKAPYPDTFISAVRASGYKWGWTQTFSNEENFFFYTVGIYKLLHSTKNKIYTFCSSVHC